MSEIAYTNDGWPKLLRDVKDLPVQTVRELLNGYVIIPAGTKGVITYGVHWNKLTFVAERCRCCSVQPKISGCGKRDFEPC